MRPLGTLITVSVWFAVAIGTCVALQKARSEDTPRAHCVAPDGSRFTLPPLRKRSINADYLVEYRPYQHNTVWYHSSLDSFGVPLGTTVYLKGGVAGAVLETRCE